MSFFTIVPFPMDDTVLAGRGFVPHDCAGEMFSDCTMSCCCIAHFRTPGTLLSTYPICAGSSPLDLSAARLASGSQTGMDLRRLCTQASEGLPYRAFYVYNPKD